jgi:hypothetical protein
MGDEGSAGSTRGLAAGEDLAFAAFVFAHLGCAEATVELRLGEDLLVEWCPVCAVLAAFGSPES